MFFRWQRETWHPAPYVVVDRQRRRGCLDGWTQGIPGVLQWGWWIFGLGLVGLAAVYDYPVGQLGLMSAGIGIVLNVRGFFLQMEERERKAFEFGRQVGATEKEVTRLR